MARPRNLPALDRTQGGRPAPFVGPEIRDAERTLPGAMSVPIEQIVPDPSQPRTSQDPARLEELAASLREYGVLQPLLVREDGFLDDGRARYMIVAGGRRYAAAQMAGLSRLPVVVRGSAGATLRLTQLVENIQRQDLAPLDEARAFKELIEAEGLSAEALGARLHISGQQIRERLRLLSDQMLADAVERGQIAPSVARAVQRLPDAVQKPVRERVRAGEAVPLADVQAVQAESAAAGIANPRAKGGGRRARADQAVLDPAGTRSLEALDTALEGLDVSAVMALLRYGSQRSWSCQELLVAIQKRQRRRGTARWPGLDGAQ